MDQRIADLPALLRPGDLLVFNDTKVIPARLVGYRGDYQTIFARAEGAVAAPTAGLHFTQALLETLADRGIGWTTLTRHVGGHFGNALPRPRRQKTMIVLQCGT